MTNRSVTRVLSSMKKLAERLAVLAFRSGHETGDVAHYERDDTLELGDLWFGYWEQVYRPLFVSAYFAISEACRNDLRVRRLPDRGLEWFLDAIRALETRRTRSLPPPAPLTFFDGVRDAVAREARDLERRIRDERPAIPRHKTAIPSGEIDATGLPGLALGDGLEAAFAMFGKPPNISVFESREFPVWPQLGLQLSACRPGYVVTAISAFWDKKEFVRATSTAVARTFRPAPFRARNGLGPDASARSMIAAYGKPSFDNRWKQGARVVRSLRYGELRFELDNDALVLVAIGT